MKRSKLEIKILVWILSPFVMKLLNKLLNKKKEIKKRKKRQVTSSILLLEENFMISTKVKQLISRNE